MARFIGTGKYDGTVVKPDPTLTVTVQKVDSEKCEATYLIEQQVTAQIKATLNFSIIFRNIDIVGPTSEVGENIKAVMYTGQKIVFKFLGGIDTTGEPVPPFERNASAVILPPNTDWTEWFMAWGLTMGVCAGEDS